MEYGIPLYCPAANDSDCYFIDKPAVKDFVDGVLQKYIPDHVAPQFTDDERQEIVTAMAYDPHMLNNPRHFDIFAIKAVLK